MIVKKLQHISFLVLLVSFVSKAQNNSENKPDWLDTISPRLSIQPSQQKHNKVISVSIKSSERGTIWYRIGADGKFREYKKPISFTRDGNYQLFYYAEDDFGNKTAVDSSLYILDTKRPEITISPQSGAFKQPVYLHARSDEECTYYLLTSEMDSVGVAFSDSLLIRSPQKLRVKAIDEAGNITISKMIEYIIDTTSLHVSIDPEGGIYNRSVFITFKNDQNVTVWYTFDPLASSRWFTKYEEQFSIPHGLSSVRYFAKTNSGIQSEIFNTRYIVDTIPPNLISRVSDGKRNDTLRFSCRERADIRYTTDGTYPTLESNLYSKPLIIPRTGIQRIKARAWDIAGNTSEIFEWEYKYDYSPPEVTIATKSGAFTKSFILNVKTNELAKVLYTLDNTPPNENALIYTNNGIVISKEDTTIFRVIAIDSAGNRSKEQIERYYLDTKPPQVKARIDGSLQTGTFSVSLISSEPSTIYYVVDGNNSAVISNVYTNPIQMTSGQVLQYYAIDKLGNKGQVRTMDELRRPLVEANPGGGLHNRKLQINFSTNSPGIVYWRILPDTIFLPAEEEIVLDREGIHTLEFFLETEGGLRGSVHRQEYVLDWTPPSVEVSVRKGKNDSANVFLKSEERASYYYTIDGTNPLTSSTTGTAGNKYLQNNGRLVFKRRPDLKLAIYAEDAAGNQSPLSVLNIFEPHAVPDIPPGEDRIYRKALSINFNTFDDGLIYFTTDGSIPSRSSEIFSKPLTLLTSDTIQTMVVDASGFMGVVDTFIYNIDLPPTPLFSIFSDNVFVGDKVVFDASASFDKESIESKLRYRWDFDGDSVFDTDTLTASSTSHIYHNVGYYKVTLQLIDERGQTAEVENECIVKDRCPVDMVSVVNNDNTFFCIDKYEWPNIENEIPLTGVSWVEAKMSCIDAGKRLCSAKEWVSACQGLSQTVYPYADTYSKENCSVDEKRISKSGAFSKCETNGAFDMLGNVWEWVEDKNGKFPLSYGGSFRYGKLARCNLKSESNVASQTSETGFRCCK